MRAFPQFIESLLILLDRIPNLRVEIAGEDQICYGGRSPKKHSSWGLWAKSKLSKAKLGARVNWLGRLNQSEYVTWLQNSSCHVYLTHPFVASWSLLEAISCNCPLVVSDVEPVRELCEKAKATVNYVDHRNSAGLADAMEMTIATTISNPTGRGYPDMSSYSTAHSLKEWSRVAGLQLTTDD